MVKKGIVLGDLIYGEGNQFDEAYIDLITNLPPPTYLKDVRSLYSIADLLRNLVRSLSSCPSF